MTAALEGDLASTVKGFALPLTTAPMESYADDIIVFGTGTTTAAGIMNDNFAVVYLCYKD